MIGQENLIKQIPDSLDKLPHTLLIEGVKGSGKHTLVKEIGLKFGIEPFNLKERGITFLNDLLLSPFPSFCFLDLTGISIKDQNEMLKFLEEPTDCCYYFLLCENSNLVLPTVLNRCQSWKIEPYTKEQLKYFYDEYTMLNEFQYTNENLLNIAKTPGDIINLLNSNIDEVITLIQNIINNIGNANFSNALVLVDKIKEFNDTKSIVDFDTFLKIFFFVLKERIKTDSNIRLYDVYFKLQELYNFHKMPYLHLNEKHLYERFLLDLKYLLK